MNKLILTAAALAILATPVLAENAKSGARTLTPFGSDSYNYDGYVYADPASDRKVHALTKSTQTWNPAWSYGDSRRGRADR